MCMVKNKIDNIIFNAEMEEFKEVEDTRQSKQAESRKVTIEERGPELEDASDISSIVGMSLFQSSSAVFEDL